MTPRRPSSTRRATGRRPRRPACRPSRRGVRPADPSANWDRAPGAPRPRRAGNWDSQWDPTLPAIPSAFVSGDPIAIINTVLGISSTSAQVTADMGRNFLQKLGILPDADRLSPTARFRASTAGRPPST